MTATSDPQVFLQTISNLPLSLDKVYLWRGLSACLGQYVFIRRSYLLMGIWSANASQLILPPTSHPESIN